MSNDVVVEPGLAYALADFVPPIAHLDFETIAPAIPVWPGCRPYDAVPVQFSCDIERGPRLEHHEWLAEGPGDPREAFAKALIAAVRGARTIVVYNEGFEIARMRELADAVPHLAGRLESVIERVVDLLPVVRAYVYHPAFGGSFGLKAVAPALVPTIGYDALEIADGNLASKQLEALLLRGDEMITAERRRLRRALLAYCALDTAATLAVV